MWIRQHGAGTMAMMSLALLFSPSRHAGAQQGPPPESPESTVVFFQYNAAAENPAAATASPALRQKLATAGAPPKPDFLFASAEGFGSGTTVIGAPYSAEATTEIVQTLADGNRIVRRTSSTLARDSQGRTRRDQTLAAIGPWVAPPAGSPPQLSFITDPVAGVQYVLDHNQRTAHKMPLPAGSPGMASLISAAPAAALPVPFPPGVPRIEWKEHFDVAVAGPPGTAGARIIARKQGVPAEAAADSARTEPLGKQTIEGVEVDGTRTTITIPAGQIGNELPIEIVSERWFSPALQVVVLSTHRDPRLGTTTYRLTGISRNEPDPSLFQVPAGYTLAEPPVISAEGFAECAAAGNPITESFPRQCRAADGKTYVEPPPPGSGPRPFTMPLPRP